MLVAVLGLALSGDDPVVEKGSAAPAATASPAPDAPQSSFATPESSEAPAQLRPQESANPRKGEDMDGEETEEDVKARLEAVDRARADEDKWMKDLEQRTGGDENRDAGQRQSHLLQKNRREQHPFAILDQEFQYFHRGSFVTRKRGEWSPMKKTGGRDCQCVGRGKKG